MKKFKKCVAVVLLSLTLFNTTFNSYVMTAQAAEAIPITMSLYEAFMSMFGLQVGLGGQTNYFNALQEDLNEYFQAIASRNTYSVPSYGEVNFSDATSVFNYLQWASRSYEHMAGNNVIDVSYDNSVLSLAKQLDSISYKMSGTSATTAMNNMLSEVYGNLASVGEATKENLQEIEETIRMWYVIANMSGNNNGDDNDDDEDEDVKIDSSFWKRFVALTSASVIGFSSVLGPLAYMLAEPGETEYQGFSDAFIDSIGFDGREKYEVFWNTDRNTYYHVMGYYKNYKVCYFSNVLEEEYPRCMLYDGTQYQMHYYNGSLVSCRLFLYNIETGDSNSYDSIPSGTFACPVFANKDNAYAYYKNGDTSGILNLVDGAAYPNFKQNVGTASETVSVPLNNWLDTNPSIDHIPTIVIKVLEATEPSVGTSDYIPAIDSAIQDATGIKTDPESNPGSDSSSGTSPNYTNILEKILAAIQFFNNPVGAILTKWDVLLEWLYDFKLWLEETRADFMSAFTNNPNGPIEDDGDGSFKNFINGLLMLIYIFFILLKIFLHLLAFIVNVFKIPADPGFITGDFAVGFNYIKTVQLSPLNMSIYDFLMGLVHILVLFSVVKVLKKHIDRIHL